MVDFLRAVDYELFFDLSAANVQPVGKEFSDIFLKEIDALLEFERFSEFDDDSVEGVKIVAVVTAVGCEVHDGQRLFLAVRVAGLGFLPIDEHGLDATPWLCLEDQGLVGEGVVFNKGRNLMNVFFLSGEKGLMMVMCNGGLAGTNIKRMITQCSGYSDRRGTFFQEEWFKRGGLGALGKLRIACQKYFPYNEIRFREVLLQSSFIEFGMYCLIYFIEFGMYGLIYFIEFGMYGLIYLITNGVMNFLLFI